MPTKKVILESRLKGANKTKQGLKGIDGGLKSLGKSAVGVAGAYFGAMGLISGFSAAIRLAGEQEKAEKKLEVALGGTSQALLDQASALQKVTTFGDEAIIGVQASLAAFLDSEDAIKKATEATLDISVAMGMDLKAAGDLVAKTLGSSTNAMSRYGIEVEGAVGSTERLESLTGNVAKLFGGQARAQAETMAGSIEQMKNAVGDAAESLGETLAPVVITIAGGFKSAAEMVGSFFKNLSTPDLDDIIENLKSVNAEVGLITEIEKLKLTTELIDVNTELRKMGEGQTTLSDVGDRVKETSEDLTYQITAQAEALADGRNKTAGFKQTLIEKHQEEAKELANLGELLARREKLKELIDALNITQKESIKKTKDEITEVEKADLAWQSWLTSMREKDEENKKEIERIEKLKAEYPELAKSLGIIKDAKEEDNKLTEEHNVLLDRQILHMEKLAMIKAGMVVEDEKLTEGQQDFIKFTGDVGKAMQGTSQLLATAAGDDVKRQIEAMRISQFAAIANTAKEATKVLTNPLALAGVLATGAAQVLAIQNAIEDAQSAKAAAFGANEVVNKPTLFLTGEAGPEHVQVTPLTPGMNQNGPQGGVTIQIQGNMIGNESFVRDTLIPEISKATNQGLA